MGFERKHTDKVTFASCNIKDERYMLSTWLITVQADLDHLAEIVFFRFLYCKVIPSCSPFFISFYYIIFLSVWTHGYFILQVITQYYLFYCSNCSGFGQGSSLSKRLCPFGTLPYPMGGCVSVWVGAWVCVCVRVCVCFEHFLTF